MEKESLFANMSFRFDPKRGIVFPTTIWGPNNKKVVAHLALDTGATDTVISWNIAHLAGYTPANEEKVQLITGSGVEFVPQFQVNKIGIVGLIRPTFTIVCHTLPPEIGIDGVLGLDFFTDVKLVIDFREGIVSIE